MSFTYRKINENCYTRDVDDFVSNLICNDLCRLVGLGVEKCYLNYDAVEDKEGTIILTIEVPGVKKEDIKVTTEKDTVFVKVTKKSGKEVSCECSYNFQKERDISKLSAKLDLGLLIIKVPKQESIKPKIIQIE